MPIRHLKCNMSKIKLLILPYFPDLLHTVTQLMVRSKILQSCFIFLFLMSTVHVPAKINDFNFKIHLEYDQILLFPLTQCLCPFELLQQGVVSSLGSLQAIGIYSPRFQKQEVWDQSASLVRWDPSSGLHTFNYILTCWEGLGSSVASLS